MCIICLYIFQGPGAPGTPIMPSPQGKNVTGHGNFCVKFYKIKLKYFTVINEKRIQLMVE